MKKAYVKPAIAQQGSVSVIVSMSCSSGGSGRSYCAKN